MKQFTAPYGPSQPSTLLVLEETPFWSAELQRQLGSEAISIRLRCRVEDAWGLLTTGHVKMLVVGPDIGLPAVLQLLTRMADLAPAVRVTVLVTPQTRDLEWSLRELGAVDILTTPFESRDLVGIVQREFSLARTETRQSAHHESKPSLSNR
jgi:DNA-binding NtrC family response regulator